EPTASEADLSFAGLSDLLAGVLPEVINGIPGPQREALEVALLLRPAVDQPPTAHAVGLAALAALRASLAHGPVLLAVDDVQWLDEASLDALVFALRRVTSGPLSVLLAARTEAPADPQTAGAPPLPRGWRELLTALPAAGHYAAASAALDAAGGIAAWHDWPPKAWYPEPRCELLITAGDTGGALRLADTNLPDDEETPVPVRYMGLLIRGRVSAWRGDAPGTVRFFERAARYADQMDWADPGVRNRLDIPLAEAYVAVGRPHDAGRISAWLREIGGRLGRPALT